MLKALGFLSVVLLVGCGQGEAPAIGESLEMVLVSGDSQSAVVGRALANPVVVRVTNPQGKPVSGALINFRVVSGGGSVYAGAALSDAKGLASELWTLGTQAGPQSLEARAVSASGAPLSYGLFKATSVPDLAKKLVARTPAETDGLAGLPLSPPPAVQIADQYGNAVATAGIPVAFAVSAGGGSVSGGAAVSDATGAATVGSWTLGVGTNSQGKNTLVASSPGLDDMTFDATGRQATATLAIVAGDAQTALVGVDPLPVRPKVRVTDQFGNAVAGYALTFSVTSGGGLLDGGVTSRTVPTDYDGTASTGWTLGQAYGENTLTAIAGATNPGKLIFRARRIQQVTLSPEQLDFGDVSLVPSDPLTITLTNYGPETVQCNKERLLSPGFTETLNTCSNVLPNQTCTVSLAFMPQMLGPTSGTYQPLCHLKDSNGVTLTTLATAATATLTGKAIPEVAVSPSQLSFGTVVVGFSSAALTVTITNNGTRRLQCNKGSFLSPGFTESGNLCSDLQPNASCTTTLTFVPNATGPISGSYQPYCHPRDSAGVTDFSRRAVADSATLSGAGRQLMVFTP